MTNLSLQTQTECKLYVEALLLCISRGIISVQKACSDLVELAVLSYDHDVSPTLRQRLAQRTEGIMAAYASGAIEGTVAIASFESLLSPENDAGPNEHIRLVDK